MLYFILYGAFSSPIQPIYRPSLRTRLNALFAWLFCLLFIGLPGGFYIIQTVRLAQENGPALTLLTGVACFLAPLGLALLLLLIQLTVAVFSLFFTAFIKTTPAGLEYRLWPSLHIRCAWSELDRLEKFLFNDLLTSRRTR